MAVEKLGAELQYKILKLMFENEVFALNCLSYLQSDYFDNKYLYWTFDKIKKYREKYLKLPSMDVLKNLLSSINEEERLSYSKILDKIQNTKVVEAEYIKDEITSFIQTSEFKKMHSKQAELFNSQQYEDSYKYTAEQIMRIQSIKFKEDSHLKSNEIDELLDKEDSVVPTGLPLLDDQLYGGIPKRSVTTLISRYNGGKSVFGISLVRQLAMANIKVLYLFHEDRKELVVRRLISSITGIPYNALKAKEHKANGAMQRAIDGAKALIEKNVRMKQMKYVGVCVEDVFDYSKVVKQDGFDFEILVDDYAQNLTARRTTFKEQRHRQAHVWDFLDKMAEQLNIAIFTMAQVNREQSKLSKQGKDIITSDGIAECIDIARISETVLTWNRSQEQEENNKAILFVDKTREGRANLLIECNTDFRSMRAYDKNLGYINLGYGVTKDD